MGMFVTGGFGDNDKKIKPWSETRSEQPVDLGELGTKNVRLLNPLAAADFYFESYDGKAQELVVKNPQTGEEAHYELYQNYANEETSSHFKVMRNPETGHCIMLSKGTDLPIKDEGGGLIVGFSKDVDHLTESGRWGSITDQVIDAEQVYLSLLEDPNVKSIEVIGYSIGSIPANYLASVYDAQVTNIADLGVPGTDFPTEFDKDMAEKVHASAFLRGMFDVSSNGMFPGVAGEFKTNLDENVVGLKLSRDVFGSMDTGKEFGNQISLELDEDNPTWAGIMHIPMVYANAIAEKYPEAPTVDTVSETENIFTPLKNDL